MVLGTEVKEGFFVVLAGDKATEGKVFQVKRREAFGYKTGDTTGTDEFSTTSSGSDSGFKNISKLEPDTEQIVWAKWHPKTGGRYQMKLKAGTIRFGPEREPNVGFLDNEMLSEANIDEEIADEFAFWMFKDWYPSVGMTNNTINTVTPEVQFVGYKYDIQEMIKGQAEAILASGKFSIITLGGVSISGGFFA